MESTPNSSSLSFESLLKQEKPSSIAIEMPKSLPGENILSDTLLNVKPSIDISSIPTMDTYDRASGEGQCPYSKRKGNISGCPFMNSRLNETEDKKFDYHYEIPKIQTTRDFYFHSLNYNSDSINKAKWLRTMPNYLRNTLFIKNENISKIRKKEYSQIFLIIEDLKEKAHDLYKSKKYQSAINAYTLIYSILRWLEFKDPEKEKTVLENYDFSKENAIMDDDIIIKRVETDPNMKFEEDSFKTSLLFILKSLSYCYLNLRIYSEAIKCMDEALEYAVSSKPDILFRKAQAIMYNKFSTITQLENALNDMKQAEQLRIERGRGDEKILTDHINELSNLIKEKQYTIINNIHLLLDSTAYSYDIINKKNLNVHDSIWASYEDVHFNYKVIQEMKDTYYSSIKFYQDTQKEKELKVIIKEFEKFFDFYYEFMFYYNLRIGNIKQEIIDKLDRKDVEIIQNAKTNQSIMLLFNDYRLKKCHELFSEYDFNYQIWKFCFDIVNEREKKKKEEKKEREKEMKKHEKWKLIKNPFSNNTQFAVFSMVLFTITLFIIGFHVMYYYDKDDMVK